MRIKYMCNENIFKKIILGKIPAKIVYKDKILTAFYDIHPIAPIHILIIPNLFIPTINEINQDNKDIFGHMLYIATKIAKKLNIQNSGYRLIINCNADGGQEIKYVHLHLLGGKKLNSINLS